MKSNLVAKFIYNIILKQTYVIEQNADFHPNFQIKQKDFEDTSKKSPVAWACLRGKGPLPLGFCSANSHKMLHCNLTKPSWGLGNTKPRHFYSCAGILERCELWTTPGSLWEPLRGPQDQKCFHNNTKMLSTLFTLLTFVLMIQKQWWIKCWHLGSHWDSGTKPPL